MHAPLHKLMLGARLLMLHNHALPQLSGVSWHLQAGETRQAVAMQHSRVYRQNWGIHSPPDACEKAVPSFLLVSGS